jgi:hypothetical protein
MAAIEFQPFNEFFFSDIDIFFRIFFIDLINIIDVYTR